MAGWPRFPPGRLRALLGPPFFQRSQEEISEKGKKAALGTNIFFRYQRAWSEAPEKSMIFQLSGMRGYRKKYPERRKADFFRDPKKFP